MKPRETVDFHIKSAWHNISKIYNEQGAPYGATAATGFVLLNIDAKEGSPVTSIGPALGMEPGSLSRILKKLEKRLKEKQLNFHLHVHFCLLFTLTLNVSNIEFYS